jgi:hypothetical protein
MSAVVGEERHVVIGSDVLDPRGARTNRWWGQRR